MQKFSFYACKMGFYVCRSFCLIQFYSFYFHNKLNYYYAIFHEKNKNFDVSSIEKNSGSINHQNQSGKKYQEINLMIKLIKKLIRPLELDFVRYKFR
ncbi:hypothetical protein BpHYR1_008398 [Brachionus plicatilis]|uniref:Uncharacterized protein n=1 Tax=Brachionus plicatilis TaxID=10195 RepID=A0A3M7RWY9_BRAPC|nr:hypothetical protein BpHYR1_008398 [Brachionus plicatilis]